jgi:hypothetical protein
VAPADWRCCAGRWVVRKGAGRVAGRAGRAPASCPGTDWRPARRAPGRRGARRGGGGSGWNCPGAAQGPAGGVLDAGARLGASRPPRGAGRLGAELNWRGGALALHPACPLGKAGGRRRGLACNDLGSPARSAANQAGPAWARHRQGVPHAAAFAHQGAAGASTAPANQSHELETRKRSLVVHASGWSNGTLNLSRKPAMRPPHRRERAACRRVARLGVRRTLRARSGNLARQGLASLLGEVNWRPVNLARNLTLQPTSKVSFNRRKQDTWKVRIPYLRLHLPATFPGHLPRAFGRHLARDLPGDLARTARPRAPAAPTRGVGAWAPAGPRRRLCP